MYSSIVVRFPLEDVCTAAMLSRYPFNYIWFRPSIHNTPIDAIGNALA